MYCCASVKNISSVWNFLFKVIVTELLQEFFVVDFGLCQNSIDLIFYLVLNILGFNIKIISQTWHANFSFTIFPSIFFCTC